MIIIDAKVIDLLSRIAPSFPVFLQVMDALDDDEQIRRPGGCCVVS